MKISVKKSQLLSFKMEDEVCSDETRVESPIRLTKKGAKRKHKRKAEEKGGCKNKKKRK